MSENECWSLSDLSQLEMDTDFFGEVMHDSEVQQNYYCVVVMSISTSRGICYTGVIANDTTHEMIEFSAEIPEEF